MLPSSLSWWGLVQDYIPGFTLQDLLAKGTKFSEQELKKIARDILQILIYLHQLNPAVLHRDIKPSNLIQGENKQIYLVDFGAVQDRMAVTGLTFTVVGTIGYTPMEQFWGRAVPASDLYGLGATLIHLLTGVAPAELPQNNLRIQFANHASVSDNFVNWIQKLTEPALEQRFSTAHEALAVINQGLKSSSSQTLFSKNNPVIHRVRPFLVVTKKSPEELEIYRYKQPGENKAWITLIIGFLVLFVGLPTIVGGFGITVLSVLCWLIFMGKILDNSINREVNLLRQEKLENAVNLLKQDRYGGYIRFDAKNKRFVFKSRWFGLFDSGSELIANIRSIYVCQQSESLSSGRYGTRVNDWQVIIRTDRNRVRLNWRLNEEECAWLVNEIQIWLHQY
ncbi:MAG: protein kinase [Nostoc sp. LLA-1]|nr:protein kinase [Cyanocohniella sp. LLY]